MKDKPIQIIGWIGAILILGAYFLVSFSGISANSLIYQLLNMFGALGIVIETLAKKDYQPMVLNAVWLLVAIFAILRVVI